MLDMAKKKKTTVDVKTFTVKKCPYCYSHLAVNANRCDRCGKRVGPVQSTGWAKKTVDVKAYLIAIVSATLFIVYFWWAFMR
jgi:predicted amidophosphoribosyltransferase